MLKHPSTLTLKVKRNCSGVVLRMVLPRAIPALLSCRSEEEEDQPRSRKRLGAL